MFIAISYCATTTKVECESYVELHEVIKTEFSDYDREIHRLTYADEDCNGRSLDFTERLFQKAHSQSRNDLLIKISPKGWPCVNTI